MEEEIEREQGGVTIGQIFRTIFSEKWLALIIAVAITVVGTLGLYFLGKRSEVYSVSFVLQLPDSDSTSSTSYTYPDGSSFYYTDLKSYDNLKEVASREGFTHIDVAKINKKGDITISLNSDSADSLNYTISVKSKYFSGKGEARNFIEELASIPCEHISSMHINYDKSLTASKDLITYDGRLDKLKEQAQFILSKYEDLISSYGTAFVVNAEGHTLGYYYARLETFLNKNSTLDNLKTQALSNQYVVGDDDDNPLAAAIAQYAADKLTKEDKRDEIKKALDRLYVGTDGQATVIVDATVLGYALQVEQLEKEIEYYEKFTAENCKYNADFDRAVKTAEAQVEAFTTEYAGISSTVYKNKSAVNYLTTGVVEVSGGRGILMSAVISLVLGLVVAAIVAYIVGYNKQKKATASKAAAAPAQSAEIEKADGQKEDGAKKDEKDKK